MARKKSVPEPETPAEEPVINYQEIHETPVENLVGPADTQAAKEIEEEAAAPEKLPEKEPEEVEIEWDPAKFEEEMTKKMGEVSEESAKKILEKVTQQKEPTKETEQELISPWAKENRTPKDYEEIADWAVEKKRILDERKANEDRISAEKQSEAQRIANEGQVKQFNAYVDNQLNELIEDGKIPAIENSLNPNDPGIIVRKGLFQKMLDVNLERQKAGKQPIYSVKEIFYEHFDKNEPEEEEPAGADAPVSAGKAPPQKEPEQITYKEIHRKSFFDILTGK